MREPTAKKQLKKKPKYALRRNSSGKYIIINTGGKPLYKVPGLVGYFGTFYECQVAGVTSLQREIDMLRRFKAELYLSKASTTKPWEGRT